MVRGARTVGRGGNSGGDGNSESDEDSPGGDSAGSAGRRAVLAAGLAALAGCGTTATGSGGPRSLTPTLTKVRRHPEGWLLSTIVEATAERSGAAFHDVSLLGYALDGTRVCEKPLGDLPIPGGVRTQQVTAVCSGFPTVVTLDAAESPCDDGVALAVAVADRVPTGSTPAEEPDGVAWSTRDRRCGEGLPPDADGATPTE